MRDTSIKRAPNAAVCTKSIRSHVIRNCICLLFTDRKCAMQGGAQRNREKMASQNISMGFSLHSQPCADDDDETKLINNLHYICVFSCLFYFFFSGMREQPSSFFLAAGFFCFVHRAISYRVPTPLCVCVIGQTAMLHCRTVLYWMHSVSFVRHVRHAHFFVAIECPFSFSRFASRDIVN